MAKNKSKKRKYDPTKASRALARLADKSTVSAAAIVLSKTSSMTTDNLDGLLLPASRQRMIMISARMSLNTLYEAWEVHSFRSLTHWYRVMKSLAQSLDRPYTDKQAQQGLDALMELSDSDDHSPVCTDAVYQRLSKMLDELEDVLQFTPVRVLFTAEAASRTVFNVVLGGDWHNRDPRVRAVLPQIIRGSSLRALTPDGMSGSQMRDEVKQMGWILHGLMDGSNEHGMPQTLSDLRSLRHHVLPVIEKLESGWLRGEDMEQVKAEAMAALGMAA